MKNKRIISFILSIIIVFSSFFSNLYIVNVYAENNENSNQDNDTVTYSLSNFLNFLMSNLGVVADDYLQVELHNLLLVYKSVFSNHNFFVDESNNTVTCPVNSDGKIDVSAEMMIELKAIIDNYIDNMEKPYWEVRSKAYYDKDTDSYTDLDFYNDSKWIDSQSPSINSKANYNIFSLKYPCYHWTYSKSGFLDIYAFKYAYYDKNVGEMHFLNSSLKDVKCAYNITFSKLNELSSIVSDSSKSYSYENFTEDEFISLLREYGDNNIDNLGYMNFNLEYFGGTYPNNKYINFGDRWFIRPNINLVVFKSQEDLLNYLDTVPYFYRTNFPTNNITNVSIDPSILSNFSNENMKKIIDAINDASKNAVSVGELQQIIDDTFKKQMAELNNINQNIEETNDTLDEILSILRGINNKLGGNDFTLTDLIDLFFVKFGSLVELNFNINVEELELSLKNIYQQNDENFELLSDELNYIFDELCSVYDLMYNYTSDSQALYEQLLNRLDSMASDISDIKGTTENIDKNVTNIDNNVTNIYNLNLDFKEYFEKLIKDNNDNFNDLFKKQGDILKSIDDNFNSILDKLKDYFKAIDDDFNDLFEKLDDMFKELKSIDNTLKLILGIDILDMILENLDKAQDEINNDVSSVTNLFMASGVTDMMSKKFPFSIPYDIYYLFSTFAADPVAPTFTIDIKLERVGIDESIEIDLSMFNTISKLSRLLLTFTFSIYLLKLSQSTFKGGS